MMVAGSLPIFDLPTPSEMNPFLDKRETTRTIGTSIYTGDVGLLVGGKRNKTPK
jgi:hypothetical protein